VPVLRGRNTAGRADAGWTPVAPGLTPHGLRHTYKSMMIELGPPAALMDAQMGHQNGSVQAHYTYITPAMSDRLLASLTELWEEALARRSIDPGSPVGVLDRLLRKESADKIVCQPSPTVPRDDQKAGSPWRGKPALTCSLTWWAILGSNQWPLRCERSALPLS